MIPITHIHGTRDVFIFNTVEAFYYSARVKQSVAIVVVMDTKSPNLEHLSERIDSVEFGETGFSKLVSQPVYLLAIVVTPINHAHYNA